MEKQLNIQDLIIGEEKGYYFESYSELDSHENMIKDQARTLAYKRAIEMNEHLFRDKIVLDVGCGLGILSLFAAKAGAKLVIGIDASDITVYAEKIIKTNKIDNIVIVNNKVEKMTELPFGVEKVDIIISEWMGICLYHESMLSTVLYARDRWLIKGGLMFPDKVQLYLAAIDDHSKIDRIEKWNYIYGFNFEKLKDIMYSEATLSTVDSNKVATNYCLINEINLYKATPDFSFTTEYTLKAERDCSVIGFVTYFDAIFSKCHKPVILSTSPGAPLTHWRQTIFRFRNSMWIDKGSEITGTFALRPYKYNFRDLFFEILSNSVSERYAHHYASTFVLR